jgi:hypothetical protein
MARDHWEKQQAQKALRETMSLWGGWQTHLGLGARELKKKFYFQYGLDTLTAQALPREDADKLRLRIEAQLNQYGVVPA